MKKNIRLSQSGFRNLVRESVSRMLTEVDWNTYPDSIDYRDKDAWWKTQVDNDFPGHKIEQSNDWKTTYSDLNIQKKKDEKEAAKQARIDARNKRKEERERAKRERQAKRANGEKPRKTTASMKYGNGRLAVELLPDGRVGWYLLDEYNEVANVGEMEIEEYTDGTWLPYTETYGPGKWIPKQLVDPVAKLFKKIGMRDDNWYNLGETKIRRIVREAIRNVVNEATYVGNQGEYYYFCAYKDTFDKGSQVVKVDSPEYLEKVANRWRETNGYSDVWVYDMNHNCVYNFSSPKFSSPIGQAYDPDESKIRRVVRESLDNMLKEDGYKLIMP